MNGRVLVLTPDVDEPLGRVKTHYRIVDRLRRRGVDASVVHRTGSFRCTWFDNDTPVVPHDEVSLTSADVLVVPGRWLDRLAMVPAGARTIVLSHSAETTAMPAPRTATQDGSAPKPDRFVSLSDSDRDRILQMAPDTDVIAIRAPVDTSLFHVDGLKQRRIAFMPGSRPGAARDVVTALQERQSVGGWTFTPIEGKHERDVAQLLRDAAIYLSFNRSDSNGTSALEAAASGCTIIGYHQSGSRPVGSASYWVRDGEVGMFVHVADDMLRRWNERSTIFRQRALDMAQRIAGTHDSDANDDEIAAAFTFADRSTASPLGTIPSSMWTPIGRAGPISRLVRRSFRRS